MQCIAIKRNGTRCTHEGRKFEQYCGTHFNSMLADYEYARRLKAHDPIAYRVAIAGFGPASHVQWTARRLEIRERMEAIIIEMELPIVVPAQVLPAGGAGEFPVIRDPVGGINLVAFAQDSQNVHRSSVQSATEKALDKITARPLAPGQNTLIEVITAFTEPAVRCPMYIEAIPVFVSDYKSSVISAFGKNYRTVADHIWAFIRNHKHRDDLCLRFAQEVLDGDAKCNNGKITRLVNVLRGFDHSLDPEPSREIFQSRMASLLSAPLETREASARALFAEFLIPDDEQAVWLEPLLDE